MFWSLWTFSIHLFFLGLLFSLHTYRSSHYLSVHAIILFPFFAMVVCLVPDLIPSQNLFWFCDSFFRKALFFFSVWMCMWFNQILVWFFFLNVLFEIRLQKERQECNSGDCGNGSNNLNSSIKKSSVLMPRTISESNIELVKESLLRKESFTSSLYFNGKENVPSSEVLHRNRLSRRERSSRMTSRRKPFVVDLKYSAIFSYYVNSLFNRWNSCTEYTLQSWTSY